MQKQKSITFRCAAAQHRRLEEALQQAGITRTALISTALDSFLCFAETEENQRLSLFELVEAVESAGRQLPFADEA